MIRHEALLEQVARRLERTGTATDELMLARWRVLALCQYLVGGGGVDEIERVSSRALESFARDGPVPSTTQALRAAFKAITSGAGEGSDSILPQVTPQKRDEVRRKLASFETLGAAAIEQALSRLPSLRDRFRSRAARPVVPGIRHRLELVASLLEDAGRPLEERQRAAAAVLYVDEQRDVIPDTLGAIGLLDDDYALQLTLATVDEHQAGEQAHWTERISALWDDLPFLRGVRLRRDGDPIVTTWLDRISSFLCYTHALEGVGHPLILVQPSVACSPVHSLVSLIGLLVLDGLTSSPSLLGSLRVGQVYEIDGQFRVRYGGVLEGPPAPGWLRLEFRDLTRYEPPGLAVRMVASGARRLSSGRRFRRDDSEPIQNFFAWDEAIGTGSLGSRILLVTSRERAMELLGGVTSNGVSLLDDGLVRFVGTQPTEDLVRGGLILVTPTLERARTVLREPMTAHAIVVDGYQRLHRGRHALPFLLMRSPPPQIIVWSTRGYFPERIPGWLPEHRTVHVDPDDLPYILELDDGPDGEEAPCRTSLWQAATTGGPETILVATPEDERHLVTLIDELLDAIGASSLPDYWRYQLLSAGTTLRALVAATPARWADIQAYAISSSEAFEQEWDKLRLTRTEAFAPLARLHQDVGTKIQRVPSELNSKASALLELLGDERNGHDWRLVCDRPEQVGVAARMLRAESIQRVKPTRVRDLEVCQDCLVVGWRTASLGRRLEAHTPRRLVALVDETEARKWSQLVARRGPHEGKSVLDAVGGREPSRPPRVSPRRVPEPERPEDEVGWRSGRREELPEKRLEPCAVIWLAGESEGKVLSRHSRVLVETGDDIREVPANRITAGDRVVLGTGKERWSPAAEFTQAVVEAMEASHPDLIHDAREWRRALSLLGKTHGWSNDWLRIRLEQAGVKRTIQTLEGWLRLDQAHPIGPQHLSRELEAMWPLIGAHSRRTRSQVEEACQRIRSLQWEAGRALLKLWGGRRVDLGLDESQLEALVERLHEAVNAYEVEEVRLGAVPSAMLGWWVDPELAELYCTDRDGR